MVTDVDPELRIAVADATGEPAPEPEATDAGPSEPKPDPLAVLTERLGRIEQAVTRLDGFDPNAVRSDLGRVRTLQSRVDQLTAANPLADIDPRIAANETLLQQIADALITSDLTDDPTKAALRGARVQLDEAKGKRERAQMKNELLAEITTAAAPSPQAQEPVQDPAAWEATVRVIAYAEAKGVDGKTIPAEAWNLLPGETYDRAIARVKGVVDGLAAQDSAATRTAERKVAAGGGSPARAGTHSIETDRQRLRTDGIPMTDDAARKRIAEALGVEL